MDDRYATMRAAMIDSQLRPTGVTDPRVLAAFASVPRELFVPERLRGHAYLDEDIALDGGRGLMEPLVFGNLVMRAELRVQDRVLLIGLGGGYEAAVLARLAGEVVAVETMPTLVVHAMEALAAARIGNVSIVSGPLTEGDPGHAPYDVLFLNGAADLVPKALVDQLAEGGRFAGVLRDGMGVTRAAAGRKASGVLSTHAFFDAGVAPLPGFERPRGFRF